MTTILVNGNKLALEKEQTIEETLAGFEITQETKGVAVALNGDVIAKKLWSAVKVQPDDSIEIIRAVQGG